MDPHVNFSSFLQGTDQACLNIADDAFNSAKKYFEQSGIISDREKVLVSCASRIEDVQQVVVDSLAKYEGKNGSSKTRKWLRKASEMISHYGNILDVFVQHHPEYVSLVWGTMKALFTGVVNHAETLRLLAKSISQMSARLPRFKLMSELYPTSQMRVAIETLYSCLLKFLIRAHGWCSESKISHIYHSYTRPHELRYKDLLEQITAYSNNIIELAAIGSQAELRLMRMSQDSKLDFIISLLKVSGVTINDLFTQTVAFQSLQTSAQLDTNQQLSDLQFSQLLSYFSLSFEDCDNCFNHHLFFRNRRASGVGPCTSTNQFWLSPKLAKWSSCYGSALIIVKGARTCRLAMQDFVVDVIQCLNKSAVPTIWVLRNIDKSKSTSISSTADLMKYITFQALRQSGVLKTEKQTAMRYSQFHIARTTKEWVNIFKQVVERLGGQIYIVIDLATVRISLEEAQSFNLILELSKMLDALSDQGTATKVKIMLLVYEAEWSILLPSKVSASTIPVKAMRQKRRQSNTMRRALANQVISNLKGGQKK